MGPVPGPARLPRPRRLLDLRDRLRRAAPDATRPSGSSTASRATTCGSSTSAASATTRATVVHRPAGVRGLRARVRDPLPRGGAAGRPPAEDRPALRPARSRGAPCSGARFGWERPLWFASPAAPPRTSTRFRRGNWHDAVGEECRAVRSAVGVLDQTSFAKYEVSGPGAERLLDRLCANRLPAEVGRMCADADVHAEGRDRVRRHRHAARPRTASTSSRPPRPRRTTSPGSSARTRRRLGPRRERHRPLRRAHARRARARASCCRR